MEFFEAKIKNGSKLFMMPMSGVKSMACGAMIKVSSGNEFLEKEFGAAHALEHMLFQGTRKFATPFLLSSYIEEVGGFTNALTNKDRTFFYSKVPDYEVERSINWLNESLEKPLFKEEDWVSEKKIVIEEIKMGNDNPDRYFFDFTYKNLFGDHPIGHSVLGTEESIGNLQISSLVDFHKKFYNSRNYIFFAAGNINCDKVLNIFDKYFQSAESIPENLVKQADFSMPLQKTFITTKDFKQMKIRLSFFIQHLSLEDKMALTFFSNMLSDGSASPLFQEFRTKRNLAYSVFSSYYIGVDVGLFSVFMSTSFKDYKEIAKIAMSVIEETKNNKSRFEQTKKRMLGNLSFSFESPFSIIAEAAEDTIYLGKPMGYKEIKDKIEAMTQKQIINLVNKFLTQENLYLNVLMAQK